MLKGTQECIIFWKEGNENRGSGSTDSTADDSITEKMSPADAGYCLYFAKIFEIFAIFASCTVFWIFVYDHRTGTSKLCQQLL